jgi:hypothetical protein
MSMSLGVQRRDASGSTVWCSSTCDSMRRPERSDMPTVGSSEWISPL